MPKRTDIKSVMVIGSGPIVIGQAAEFDYSGTQACRVLREEGIRVILSPSAIAAFSAVWPPRVGSRASGRSLAMICSRMGVAIGSM